MVAPQRTTREVGIDAARVLAILLVVLLHACVAYLERPISGLLWPVQESPGETWWVDHTFWIVRTLGVPVVTLIAGCFAARAIDRGGGRAFLLERVRRLGLPLLLGTIFVLPAMYVVWAWGWVLRGWAAPIHILHVRFGPAVQPNLFGLAHLWYLQYLLLYACVYAGWRAVLPGVGMGEKLARVLTLPIVRLVVLGMPLALIAWRWPGVLVEFQNGFLPQLPKFLWNAVFFAAGVVLWRATREHAGMRRWARLWWCDGLLAIGAAVMLLPAAHEVIAPSASSIEHWRFALCAGLLAAAGGCGLLGACLACFQQSRGESRVARVLATLASATFWIYILHLVFQGLASVLLYKVELAVGVKFAIVFAAGVVGPMVVFLLARKWAVLAWMRPVRERGGMESSKATPSSNPAAPATVP